MKKPTLNYDQMKPTPMTKWLQIRIDDRRKDHYSKFAKGKGVTVSALVLGSTDKITNYK
jgi:hypothetical protein